MLLMHPLHSRGHFSLFPAHLPCCRRLPTLLGRLPMPAGEPSSLRLCNLRNLRLQHQRQGLSMRLHPASEPTGQLHPAGSFLHSETLLSCWLDPRLPYLLHGLPHPALPCCLLCKCPWLIPRMLPGSYHPGWSACREPSVPCQAL